MKMAHIMPVRHLEELDSLLGLSEQFHMVLAHRVLADSRYADYFVRRKAAGDFVSLDNSAFELGAALSSDNLIRTLAKIRPSEFVLPDVLWNKEQTIERSKEFKSEPCLSGVSLMGVPQGDTLDEWLFCYDFFANSGWVDTIGLGGVYTSLAKFADENKSGYASGREYLIDELIKRRMLCTTKPHHLLGLGDSGHKELKKFSQYSWIRSCDSSAAYMLAKNGIAITADCNYKKVREKVNFDDYDDRLIALIRSNMQALYDTCNK